MNLPNKMKEKCKNVHFSQIFKNKGKILQEYPQRMSHKSDMKV